MMMNIALKTNDIINNTGTARIRPFTYAKQHHNEADYVKQDGVQVIGAFLQTKLVCWWFDLVKDPAINLIDKPRIFSALSKL